MVILFEISWKLFAKSGKEYHYSSVCPIQMAGILFPLRLLNPLFITSASHIFSYEIEIEERS